MRLFPPSSTAIKALLVAFMLAWLPAWAEPAGQVTNLSGPLFAMNAQGVKRILSVGSQVESGEILITEDKTFAQVRFIDKGVMTLRPGTHFKVESFAFDEKVPEKDNAVFGLFKGALRAITGAVGKRSNQDAYKINTATATIGIRGTHFLVQVVPEKETELSRVPYAIPLLATLDPRWYEMGGVDELGATMTDVPTGLFSLDAPLELAQFGGGDLAPGTYTHVFEGAIRVAVVLPPSFTGTVPPIIPFVIVNTGQTSHAPVVPPTTTIVPPPVIVPTPPAIQNNLILPPAFVTSQNQAVQGPAGAMTLLPPKNAFEGCVPR